jgi:hypothetical protein
MAMKVKARAKHTGSLQGPSLGGSFTVRTCTTTCGGACSRRAEATSGGGEDKGSTVLAGRASARLVMNSRGTQRPRARMCPRLGQWGKSCQGGRARKAGFTEGQRY